MEGIWKVGKGSMFWMEPRNEARDGRHQMHAILIVTFSTVGEIGKTFLSLAHAIK